MTTRAASIPLSEGPSVEGLSLIHSCSEAILRSNVRPILFITCVIAGILASTPLAIGAEQEPPDHVGGLVRIDTYDHTTVSIDVFVRDGDDNPVTGLKREQFHLFQNDSEVPISNFTVFSQAVFDPHSPESALGVDIKAGDQARLDEAKPIYIILFIDNQFLRYSDRNRVLQALRGSVEEIMRGPVQIMVANRQEKLEIVQPFTDDPRAIKDALRLLRMEKARLDDRDEEHQRIEREIQRAEKNKSHTRSGREQEISDLFTKLQVFVEEEGYHLEQSLSAIQKTTSALTGVTGRKYLVYVSNGLPLGLGKDLFHQFAGLDARTNRAALDLPYNRKRHYDSLAAAANAQEITIYTIDATGTYSSTPGIGDSESRRSTAAGAIDRDNHQMSLRLLAENTGGLAVANSDDFAAGLDRIRADFLTFYSIGYDIDSCGSDTVHHIEIKLDDSPNYKTRYRRTFVEKSMQSRVQDDVTAGLFFDVGENPMGIEVTTAAQIKVTEKQWQQPLTVFLPVPSLTMIREGDEYVGRSILFVATRDLDDNSTDMQRQVHDFRLPVDQYEARKTDRFPIFLRLLLNSGHHRIVVGLLDEQTNQISIQRIKTTSPDED